MPQLNFRGRQTVMERIIQEYRVGRINKNKAIDKISKEAFGDVIPRFHNLYHGSIPVKFYEIQDSKIILTDNVFKIFEDGNMDKMINEIISRWDLLEAAFSLKRDEDELVNDIRKFYLEKGYDRTNITHTIPVLNGYQDDICFYCGEEMNLSQVEVDHVIPRQLIQHDEIWNLVLAHGFCNSQKEDALPPKEYIEKLIIRNEHFIKSDHPIKDKLIKCLGDSPKKRRKKIYKVYEDAMIVLGFTWEGMRGYNPSTDEFYKTFIRRYINV